MRLTGSPAAVAAAAMPQPARTKAGPTKRQQHSSTTKEQLLWGGASLRSNTGPFAGLLEQRTFCWATRTADLCRATRTEDLCRATRTEDLCRAASASPPSASVFTSPLPPARC